MNDILIKNTVAVFKKTFGTEPQKIVLSPGRINIIGEHIDYNDGYVLPAAIDKIICFAFEKSNSNTARIIAIDLDDEFEINLNDPIELSDNVWTNYVRGVILQLQNKGFQFDGVNCVFSSSIPVGSGLSSSAALECGFLFGILWGFLMFKFYQTAQKRNFPVNFSGAFSCYPFQSFASFLRNRISYSIRVRVFVFKAEI